MTIEWPIVQYWILCLRNRVLRQARPSSNLHVSAELSLMTEVPRVEVADQGIPIEARFHKVAFKGSFSLFSWISYVVGD
jgi:hypothetical protein